MSLTKKQIKLLKEKMLSEKQRVLNATIDAEDLNLTLDQAKEESDIANAEQERARLLRFRSRDLFYVKKLTQAIEKIDTDDEYGCCEECGVDIKFERLIARPTADMCIVCKDEAEREESSHILTMGSKSFTKTFEEARV